VEAAADVEAELRARYERLRIAVDRLLVEALPDPSDPDERCSVTRGALDDVRRALER